MKKMMRLFLLSALVCALNMACDDDNEKIPETPEEPELPEMPTELSEFDNYYVVDDEKYELIPTDSKYYMMLPAAKKAEVIEALRGKGVDVDALLIGEYHGIKSLPITEMNVPSDVNAPAELKDCIELIADSPQPLSIETIPGLTYIAHYYKTTNDAEIGITNIFSVATYSLTLLEKIAEEYNFVLLGRNLYDLSIYYLACTKDTKGNALQLANLMYEFGYTYATPVFLIEVEPAMN